MKRLLLTALIFFNFNLMAFSTPKAIKDEKLKLIGKALLEYSIFKIDVYEISLYYQDNKLPNSKLLFNANTKFAIVLDYKRAIEKKYSEQGWDVGLKDNLNEKIKEYKTEIKWLKKQCTDTKEKDQIVFLVNEDIVTVLKNNKKQDSIKSKKIAKIVAMPWLGTNPVDKEIKLKLIGK